ncbi:MAG: aryl-sulfate sulfotransferase [Dehalococcoidales bacterium]|nr:aryl-sulfate sulfotransferase [Dehalococcoidales bacterium]
MAATVYPTGTTIYDPEKCWNGYTVFQARMHGGADAAAVLIDMNGNVMNMWQGLDGFPNKMLPGGHIMGSTGIRDMRYGFQDMKDLVQVDWDGNIVWKFNRYELIRDPDREPEWMARQHHDYQREGNPVGYYVPGMEPLVDKGNTLILAHRNLKNPGISDKLLLDDTIIEVTWEGELVWEWVCSEHFDEMGFSEEARNAMARDPHCMKLASGECGDWMHMNSISRLGPNKWYDQGDERFHPENIIWDGRSTNIIAIISRKTGQIVWRVGPDYFSSESLRGLGQIIGQHHAHMIPRGLPGEGNILVFDNGGRAGYGAPNPGAPTGVDNALRDYSRVLEFDPVTLKVVWQYSPVEAGLIIPANSFMFYSSFVSSAQRLPNGNTLITEGACGRIFEVTRDHELVWEYVSPFFGKQMGPPEGQPAARPRRSMSMVYRAYRLPYEWIPQLPRPREKALPPIDNSKFRVPGSPPARTKRTTTLKA